MYRYPHSPFCQNNYVIGIISLSEPYRSKAFEVGDHCWRWWGGGGGTNVVCYLIATDTILYCTTPSAHYTAGAIPSLLPGMKWPVTWIWHDVLACMHRSHPLSGKQQDEYQRWTGSHMICTCVYTCMCMCVCERDRKHKRAQYYGSWSWETIYNSHVHSMHVYISFQTGCASTCHAWSWTHCQHESPVTLLETR